MVNSVSFRNVGAPSATFQDIINRPQTYTAPQTPVAASGLNEGGKKKGSAGKVIAGLLVAAAAVAGGMVYAAKHPEKLTELVGKLKDGKIKTGLDTVSKKVIEWGGKINDKVYTPIKTKAIELFEKAKGLLPKNPPAGQ